jgi:hypothetical protein
MCQTHVDVDQHRTRWRHLDRQGRMHSDPRCRHCRGHHRHGRRPAPDKRHFSQVQLMPHCNAYQIWRRSVPKQGPGITPLLEVGNRRSHPPPPTQSAGVPPLRQLERLCRRCGHCRPSSSIVLPRPSRSRDGGISIQYHPCVGQPSPLGALLGPSSPDLRCFSSSSMAFWKSVSTRVLFLGMLAMSLINSSQYFAWVCKIYCR